VAESFIPELGVRHLANEQASLGISVNESEDLHVVTVAPHVLLLALSGRTVAVFATFLFRFVSRSSKNIEQPYKVTAKFVIVN